MKRLLLAAALTVVAAFPALAADVGVSISIGDTGFYGRIDIGDYPQPRLLYREPRIIHWVETREPIYLHVPPGHAKNWRKHCHKYNACGERVYFVQDNWYNQVYVPQYRERHHNRRDDRREEREDKRSDRHEYRQDKHQDKHHGERNGQHGKKGHDD